MQDFESFADGDLSIIGDQDGIQLSGGQRQRVALARALYSRKNTYLFDEPLSAVDAQVSRLLFNQVIGPRGKLAEHTRIVVTHRIQLATEADMIVVMESGAVKHVGTYFDLMQRNVVLSSHVEKTDSPESILPTEVNGLTNAVSRFEAVVERRMSQPSEPTEDLVSDLIHESRSSLAKNDNAQLSRKSLSDSLVVPTKCKSSATEIIVEKAVNVDDQRTAEGATKLDVYFKYFMSGGSILSWIVVCAMIVVSQAFLLSSELFLAQWTTMPDSATNSSLALTYAILVLSGGLFFFLRSALLSRSASYASSVLHDSLFVGTVRAKQSFFDTHSIGRLISRFSRDTDLIDHDLPGAVQDIAACSISSMATLVLIVILTPAAAPFLLPVLYMYNRIQNFYRPASRDLKRLESSSRSPIFSHVGETMDGLITIRAYGKITGSNENLTQVNRFLELCMNKIDHNVGFYFYSYGVNRWLGTRLEVIGALLVLIASMGSIGWYDFQNSKQHNANTVNASNSWIALAITTTLAISGNLNWMVRQMSDLEIQMNAVERIIEFSQTPPEAQIQNIDAHDALLVENGVGALQLQSAEGKLAMKRWTKIHDTVSSWKELWAQTKDSIVHLFPSSRFSPLHQRVSSKLSLEIVKDASATHKWPSVGEIRAQNLVIRYRPELAPVLKGVSFEIKGGERIGIVVRIFLFSTCSCSGTYRSW